MASLELFDSLEQEEEQEFDNNTTMMDWNEAMEHEYLDRLLEETGDNNNNDLEVVPAEEPDNVSRTDDEQTCRLEGAQVTWQGQGKEGTNIDIDKCSEAAYRSCGTWWLDKSKIQPLY